ncbi:acyl-CoA dehydrogenase family protein [Sphingopyxis granuli]|uniref:Pimeloyl-CoA dehydrogenase large subunit-like protein n=2 Tax=Sphingopyxis TaxID=165697 RepID=D9PTN0_SPHMC|nr:acyl-CoA dehydrogenase family protein [Sphingopyxis granuli]ADK93990.1 pimeloyl-CoA dehydrogenase large subunit-like protein [Sphingopyxis macrogoltabida]AMG75140.1 Pimeloyl-CoA dehydrogenase large subunit-like protein [Sphingopyxis granuli]
MDIRFSAEEIDFRQSVREFLETNVPDDVRRKLYHGEEVEKAELAAWTQVLNKQGWAVPHWPVEWGGTGWDAVKQMIFRDEVQSYPAPEPLSFGASMVGPVIYTFGSEEQKRRFLPRIANLDDWWCQGFSEPGAGSDLASLKTTAQRDGDHWVVNGQKTWTTLGQHADWIFVLARTDSSVKKQAGISFLLVDMKTPGVTVRPIELIDGSVEVNEVFFDEVRVPAENLVGEENKGWDYAKFLLGNERHGQARVGLSKMRLRCVRELATASLSGGRPIIESDAFRRKLARAEIAAKALEMTVLRVVSEAAGEHGKPNPLSSILKVRGSELQQATSALLMDVAGPLALSDAEPDAKHGKNESADAGIESIAATYFNLRKLSIYGGANEIQRTIVAKTILGL